MRWLLRDSVIKISVIVAVLMTIIVSMNLIELLDKYVAISLSPNGDVRYEYQEIMELHYTIPSSYVTYDTVDNEMTSKEKLQIREHLDDFITNMPDFMGNISIPLVYFKLNEGVDVRADILMAYNEKLPYMIDYKNKDGDGIYIGNSYNGYWNGDTVTLNGEFVKIAGIISSEYLALDNSVIVPYKTLKTLAKKQLLDSLTSDIFYDRKITIIFSSNLSDVTTNDMRLMEEYISGKSLFELKSISDDTGERIEQEKDSTPQIYALIKRIVCIVSALFCFIAIFEVIRLFLNKKKKDITILWALGSKRIVVYRMLIRELGLSIVVGTALAFVFEWIIYGLIMKCRFETVLFYGIYAGIFVVLAALIMVVGITNRLLNNCRICDEK